ncbi:MAG: hypothetical protein KKE20_07260, partial [Nanoarchaeota archaeon]|nr:hypothetical protein [Nanoarchaeota archaeon]
FNIGTGRETSVNQLFNLIKSSTGAEGAEIEAVHTAAVPGEVRKISLNCDLARKQLGWEPEISIEDGIKKTVEWFDTL